MPVSPPFTVADRIWQELINVSLVRDPRVAGPLPPAWRNPVNGTPAPNEGLAGEAGDPVVGIVETYEIPGGRYESQWTTQAVDIVIRASKWPAATGLWFDIRRALIDRYGVLVGGMRMIEVTLLNGFALIDASVAQGFTGRATLRVESYAEDH